jgi:hypothetical protein
VVGSLELITLSPSARRVRVLSVETASPNPRANECDEADPQPPAHLCVDQVLLVPQGCRESTSSCGVGGLGHPLAISAI